MNSSIFTPFPGYNICHWRVAKVIKVNIELNKENIWNAKALIYVIHVNQRPLILQQSQGMSYLVLQGITLPNNINQCKKHKHVYNHFSHRVLVFWRGKNETCDTLKFLWK